MEVKRSLLLEAAKRGIINSPQVDELWDFFQQHNQNIAHFRFTHILYYLGGFIAIGAMTVFMTLGWQILGGWGLFLIAFGYALLGLVVTEVLVNQKGLTLPAGITATFVVMLTPMAVYGLQLATGWFIDGQSYQSFYRLINWNWLVMELVTIIVAGLLLWRYRLTFLTMPIAFTLWYMSMDLAPLIIGELDDSWAIRQWVSIWFGLVILLLAFVVDFWSDDDKDNAFWLYIFGVITFWGGLSLISSGSELGRLVYFLINVIMIILGALVSRRVFVIFGGFGIAGYLSYLAYSVFQHSILFPFALSFIGFGLVFLGILWQRNERYLNLRFRRLFSPSVSAFFERKTNQ